MFSAKPIYELSDAELVAAYKADANRLVAGELFKRYASLVLGVCRKYLKDKEEARDAAMQVFEKMMDTLLKHEVTHFKSWLYVSTKNHCLMHLRSAKNIHKEEINERFMETVPEEHLDDEEFSVEGNLHQLKKCIDELNAEQQSCINLFYLQEKCYQEVADHTGYDLKKVKSYIQNGKRNLKICLERNG
ncbi:MAG: sigma-70 family RNA polymerase sigma factor [Cyclobacteriaceae bacterium]|jgi:RNA polymerase sigma factor (sigma-70 family)|nr:sigma-70 family RNA polymerase sigma factor [Cyclobacteriaceae bacterium]